MATHRQELALRDQAFNFTPTTFEEALQYATVFANSGLCPSQYKGRPNDILIIWQLGAELGLGKMAALRTIGCINGTPFTFGSGGFSLTKKHPDFQDCKEWQEGSLQDGTLTCFCTITRKGHTPITKSFSIEDAKRAGLWGKPGSNWAKYPIRMLEWRARNFASRDAIPEAQYGLPSEDEVMEMQTTSTMQKPLGKGIAALENELGLVEDADAELVTVMSPLLEMLLDLINKTGTSQKTIGLWLKKAQVNRLDEMTDEQLQQGIEFLKTKQQEQK